MANPTVEHRSEIVFFDVETMVPTRPDQRHALLEFGAILVCPMNLVVLGSYSTLILPEDLSRITSLSDRCNGISKETVLSAPRFVEVADRVYDLLHGRIWAGHNILKFDCVRIKEAFDEIGRVAPEPKGTLDSWVILTQRFGRRAGNMKMAKLAAYFGLGKQTHRSLEDARMNFEVVKHCATVLLLESSVPDIFPGGSDGACFVDPDEVFIPSISVAVGPLYWGCQRLSILHKNVLLQLRCSRLRVRFGISTNTKFVDHAGRPKLNFVVDVAPNLRRVLDACDDAALKQSVASGSDSEWRPLLVRNSGYSNSPNVRLHLPTPVNGETAISDEEIYYQDSSGATHKVTYSAGEPELGTLLFPGTTVDAYVSLKLYDYKQNAGIKLVVKKLIIHSA